MDLSALITTFDSDDDWSKTWASSGAAALTGRPSGPPLPVPIALVRGVAVAARIVDELTTNSAHHVVVDGPALLGERASLLGLQRRGDTSCGGGTRLLRTNDDWIAVSLVRDSDISAVQAWLELPKPPPTDLESQWEMVASRLAETSAVSIVDRAIMLEIPCGRVGEVRADQALIRARATQGPCPPRTCDGMLVVDLSSLWAGPLCANLLGMAGARVIKVESTQRPDGARRGDQAFFDLLHGGHQSVALDFSEQSDIDALQRLLDHADVVIEASRPRALDHLGIKRMHGSGTAVWLSITGHGFLGLDSGRVAFGDDAAVAGGLLSEDTTGPCFCGDAIADPVTGLIATAAVLDRLAVGGRWHLDIALSRTAAWLSRGEMTDLASTATVAAPRHRPIIAPAHDLGADTDAVLRQFSARR